MNLFLTLFLLISSPYYRAPQPIEISQINSDLVWIYFTDKGFRRESEYNQIINTFTPPLSDAAIQRRLNYNGKIFDYDDLPVYQPYLEEIIQYGAKLRTISNWLNAASFQISSKLLTQIANLPFVYDIRPVVIHTQTVSEYTAIEKIQQVDTSAYRDFYNLTYEQNYMLGIPQVYYQGFTGSGIKLAILDTGLKRKHTALRSLRIYKEHDFLGNDNFYFRNPNGQIEPLLRLSNLSMVQSPQIITTSNNRLFIFFSADTFAPGQANPCRLLVSYSTDQGQTWSQPRSIFNTSTYNMSIPKISVANKDSTCYLVWQDLLPQAPNQPINTLYLGYFINTPPSANINLGNGKSPHLTIKDNNLYITYINYDSVLYFRKANITNIIPSLFPSKQVWIFNEPITNPIVTTDANGEIELFVQGLRTKTLYHFTSLDNGENFQMQSDITNQVSAVQTLNYNNRLYLFYKDYTSLNGKVRLVHSQSLDGGNTWQEKITIVDNALSLGNYSVVRCNDTIYLSYEIQSHIYLVKSGNFGNTWSDPILIASDFNYHPQLTSLNNRPCQIWIQRGDNNTDYEEGKDFLEQADHGTHMASIIAGYLPKTFVGVAPAVDLIIAKTELHKAISGYTYETITEEDIWIQGLEWAEREGAQIISSSLGYRSWYTEKDYDGKTIPVSIAAGLAAKRGVILVSAMGNAPLNQFPWPSRYIVAPGDADGIITAGGIDRNKQPWIGNTAATGIGPTYDGRIKPDLVALADAVTIVNANDSTTYLASSGTSCATALIAAACALILEAHPKWNADSVKQALFSTASLSTPNCTLGFGLPNIDSLLKIYPTQVPTFDKNQLANPYPIPFRTTQHQKIYFPLYLIRSPRWAELRIYTLSGELIKKLPLDFNLISVPGRYQDITNLERIGAVWDGKNENGQLVGTGLYLVVFQSSYGKDIKKFAIVR